VTRARSSINQSIEKVISLPDVAHIRIAKACNLLPNPNLWISELVFDVSFQPLSQSNRI
jgi:hypothetical protein